MTINAKTAKALGLTIPDAICKQFVCHYSRLMAG
jgi:hypothetical protein